MHIENTIVEKIPAIIWGEKADKAYIFVHGKKSRKEEAQGFASVAVERGYQVLSFDLPEHGERIHENYQCDVWNGINDLELIKTYAQNRWANLSLYACSLGAYFSLLAYQKMCFEKCLFHSPILNMERLIQNMMKWFNVNEKELKEKGEIATPIGETLSWKYFSFVKENRIQEWSKPTSIIYGENDNLTERAVVDEFADRFKCELEIINGGQHYFTSPEEINALNKWIHAHV